MYFVRSNGLKKCRVNKCENYLENQFLNKVKYLKVIESIIRKIYENRPAGLIHARVLSAIVKRSIRIWQGERVTYVFGKTGGKVKIDLEYEEQANEIGHWSLRGGKEAKDASARSGNDCLYEVVASQTGLKSSELKRQATIAIRRHCFNVVDDDECTLLLGGARYTGTGPRDAQRVLDASQNGQCHPEGWHGHPRGHASHPSSDGQSENSVESYSYSRWRSGFLSRTDQDLVCHYTLITDDARDLMDTLNRGGRKVASHISRNDLDYHPLPQAQIWSDGSKQDSPGNFRTVCLVGKHFLNQQNDPYADIFIVTFYPIL